MKSMYDVSSETWREVDRFETEAGRRAEFWLQRAGDELVVHKMDMGNSNHRSITHMAFTRGEARATAEHLLKLADTEEHWQE